LGRFGRDKSTMNTEPITSTQKPVEQQNRRWARLARVTMLTFTMAAPVISATRERLRRQTEAATTTQTETAQDWHELRARLEDLTQESRERVAQQAHYLRTQARQLQTQSRQLSKALRAEARQRRKAMERAREAGLDWGQGVLKRGEELLEPVREHSRIWSFAGFGVGMIVAGAITYRLVRGRAARRKAEDEPIELVATAEQEVVEEEQQTAVE
jgi:exonuclease VII large subunit